MSGLAVSPKRGVRQNLGEQLSFGTGAMILYRQGRLDHGDLYFGGIDLMLAVFFILCWLRLPSKESKA
jgi:hypothetical protein